MRPEIRREPDIAGRADGARRPVCDEEGLRYEGEWPDVPGTYLTDFKGPLFLVFCVSM